MTTAAAFKIIKPHSERNLAGDITEIWANRELLRVLVRREISVRYRQAVVGLLWVLLQPLLTTAIFTTVFVVFVRIPDTGESYPLFTFAGLAIWQYFSRIVSDGANSLVANSALITKVSLPRMIIPMVAPLAAALDCMIVDGHARGLDGGFRAVRHSCRSLFRLFDCTLACAAQCHLPRRWHSAAIRTPNRDVFEPDCLSCVIGAGKNPLAVRTQSHCGDGECHALRRVGCRSPIAGGPDSILHPYVAFVLGRHGGFSANGG